MSTRRPPVIPEIAKAYQNDPRTKLALDAIATGTSTAPVAAGKYAYADGIARALQGAVGGYVDRKQQEKYGNEELKTIADQQDILRKLRGDQAAVPPQPPGPAMGAPPVIPAASQGPAALPPQASAAAAALGSPPAPQQPPGPAMGGPPPIPAAPVPAPAMGGGPVGRRPFGPSAANIPSFLQAPVAEDVPDAPAPIAKPTAPEAVGPTRSKLLDAAYETIMNGNPYLFARGQEMDEQGRTEQTKLDEAAAERKQRIIDAGYETDRGIYANAASQDRGAAIRGREDVINRNAEAMKDFKEHIFNYGVHKEDQSFQAGEKAKDRANDLRVASIRERSSGGGVGQWGLTPEEGAALSQAAGEGRIDVTRLNSRTAKINAQILLANPGFDAMTNHGAAALISNAPAQQKAMMAAMLPDVLNNVREAGKKLKFSDAQPMGRLQLFTKGMMNDPDVTAYMTQRNDAMQTLAQVMSGVGATDMRTKMESEAAPKSMSPRAWDAWYQGQLKALRPRIQAYEDKRLLPKGTTDRVSPAQVPQRKPGETVAQYLARTGG